MNKQTKIKDKQTKIKDNQLKGMYLWLFSQGYMIRIMSDYMNKKSQAKKKNK